MSGNAVLAEDGPRIVPRILDPGEGGWPDEPKVTQAEELLYGEYAGIVRLTGQAAVELGNGYALACKRRAECPGSDPETDAALDAMVRDAYDAYDAARRSHRRIAERAMLFHRGLDPMVDRLSPGAVAALDGDPMGMKITGSTLHPYEQPPYSGT